MMRTPTLTPLGWLLAIPCALALGAVLGAGVGALLYLGMFR